MTISVNFIISVAKSNKKVGTSARLKWNKIDKEQYSSKVIDRLTQVCFESESMNLDDTVKIVNNILTTSARECFSY